MTAELGSVAVRAEAHESAARAAASAGVRIRELHEIAEFDEVNRVFNVVWGRGAESPLVPTELLRALSKAGSYVAGAFDGDTLIGASIGFHSAPETRTLHSHIAGVLPTGAGRAIGYALKLHQRTWALDRGIEAIEWTFDPLVARNAHFNLTKLGALPSAYLPNFYGEMNDAINAGDASDRLLVRWQLADPRVHALAVGTLVPRPEATQAIAVPSDIEGLRLSDPAEAAQWRLRVREQLTDLLERGGRIVGFDQQAGYLAQPAPDEGATP